MDKKIVIIGAGYAGILTAKKLAKRFRKDSSVSITVIDKNPFHTMLTELHEVAAGRVDESGIRISLKRVFAGRNVDVKQDLVTEIDFEKRTVVGTNERYKYDYLCCVPDRSRPGLASAGQKSMRSALELRGRHRTENRFRHVQEGSFNVDEEEKRRLLTFHIVGAGFTGVEMAGELAEYVPVLCDKYEVDRTGLDIRHRRAGPHGADAAAQAFGQGRKAS